MVGDLPLAVVSHLLSVAREFLGGPEKIDGDETNNRRLSNKEEKIPLTHTQRHGKEIEESRGCFPHLLSFKTDRQAKEISYSIFFFALLNENILVRF